MPEYPIEIKDTDFTGAIEKETVASVIPLSIERSVMERSSSNASDVYESGIAELWIESVTTGKSCRSSNDEYVSIPSSTDQSKRFHFVPLLEELKVHWKFKNQEFIKSAKLELLQDVEGKAELLWTKKITWEVGKCPEEGETPFNGDFEDTESLRQAKDSQAVTITNHSGSEDFPYKCLSIGNAPYMLRLTIDEATVAKTAYTRWLFLDVLVHSIELDWGADTPNPDAVEDEVLDAEILEPAPVEQRQDVALDPAAEEPSVEPEAAEETKGSHFLLSKDRTDIVEDDDPQHAGYKEKVWGYEKQILKDLQAANERPDVENVVHEIKLNSNLVTLAPKAQASPEYNVPVDYKEYQSLWGNGPRIPILAKVFLRKSDGTSTKADSGPAEKAKIAKAIGGSRVLWDWNDDSISRWKEPLSAGATGKTERFLNKAYNDNDRPSLPKNSCNCPAKLGGKRGADGKSVFPVQTAKDPLGFKVTPSEKRAWSSFSQFDKKEDEDPPIETGVLFQPARMAGDSYTVRAYLDCFPIPEPDIEIEAPAELQSKPAKFKVFRRVDVNYLVRGTPAKLGCTPAQLADVAKKHYLREADLELNVIESTVNEQHYLDALKHAVEEVVKAENHLGDFNNLEILVRNIVNVEDPAADGAAIEIYPKDDVLDKIKTHFKDSKLRSLPMQIGAKTGKSRNLLLGVNSGAKAQILQIVPKNDNDLYESGDGFGYRTLALLYSDSSEFENNEDVILPKNSRHPEETTKIETRPLKSCWGHTIETEENTGNDFKTKITVVINDAEVTVTYKKAMSGKLKTDLSNTELKKLKTAIRTQAEAQDESQPMKFTLRGRISSANAAEIARKKKTKGQKVEDADDNAAYRMKKLRTLIEELFNNNNLLDRKSMYEAFVSENYNMFSWDLRDERDYKKMCTKTIWTMLSAPLIIKYVELAHPGAEGILLLHVAGKTNAPELPEFSDFKEGLARGGYQPDATLKRSSGVVFLSSVAKEASDGLPSKSVEAVFCHELGHSLFLPHLKSSVPGNPNPGGSEYPEVHIEKDNCMMNYDLDSEHFCGMCMIRLRGWNWEPYISAKIPEVLEYKVDLELDDIDRVFADPTHLNGKVERLQALGLFNHPLKHPKAVDCLLYSTRHAQEIGVLDGEDFAALKPKIAEYLMEGGKIPAPGEFAKMRLPKNNILYSQGMLKRKFPEDFENWATDADRSERESSDRFMLGADPYKVDQYFFEDNPSLGKIPLKVTVRQRIKDSGQDWEEAELAPNAAVYFKLVQPDDLPAYAANPNPPGKEVAGGKSYYDQVVGPALETTPEANFIKLLRVKQGDPDGKNAPVVTGGKRTGKKTPNVFCGTLEDGFSDVSESTRDGHEFAARVFTDKTGIARICFSPSNVGGDCYKLRIYVGPPSRESDDQTLGDGCIETGTMVRWRAVRVSRNLFMPPPGSPDELPAALNARSEDSCFCSHPVHIDGPKKGICTKCDVKHDNAAGRVCEKCFGRWGGLPQVDLTGAPAVEMAKCYTDLIFEAPAEEPVSVSTFSDAIIEETEELLASTPRLNSMYWVRGQDGSDARAAYPLDVDRFTFPLAKREGSNDRIFAANLPYFQGHVALDNGNLSVIKNKSNNAPQAILFVEEVSEGGRTTKILAERVGDGILVPESSQVKVNSALVDYTTGALAVEFEEPQVDKSFVVRYLPTNLLDFRSLLYFPPKSPFLFNLRMPNDYNEVIDDSFMPMEGNVDPDVGRECPKYHFGYINSRKFGAVKTVLMDVLGRVVSKYSGVPAGPYCPGIVFVRAQALDTYSGVWDDGVQEGKAFGSTVFVFNRGREEAKEGDEPSVGAKALVLHELSHALYMFHAPGAPGGKADRHDTNYTCVMSYEDNLGDYCGKCNASMRGMKIS